MLQQCLRTVLWHTHSQECLVDLVMLVLLRLPRDTFQECTAYCCSAEPTPSGEKRNMIVTKQRYLSRTMVSDLDDDYLRRLSATPEDIGSAWATFTGVQGEVVSALDEIVVIAACHRISRFDWSPYRLDSRNMVVLIPHRPAQATPRTFWLVLARCAVNYAALLDEDLACATIVLSVLADHGEFLRLRQSVSDLQQRIRVMSLPDFADAVPFALGYRHELGHLILLQQAELAMLRSVQFPQKVRQSVLGHLDRLTGVTMSLQMLRSRLASIRDMQSCFRETVDLNQVIRQALE